MSKYKINIPKEIFQDIVDTQGRFFEIISNVSRYKIAADLLNKKKAEIQADILAKYISLQDKKVLEIGSGFGINLIVWHKIYHIDAYGVEPDGEGFDTSYKISQKICALNGFDSTRIINSPGELLPFANQTFDVVYSTNVLEHVNDPLRVLDEALRVLKPGGIAQIIFPNYHSFFDGHYSIFHPPVLWKKFFPWYIKNIIRRDPAFARTINTELNYFYIKKEIYKLGEKYEIEVLDFGQGLFMNRMTSLDFEAWAGLTIVKNTLQLLKKMKLNFLTGWIISKLGCFTPLIVTIKKKS